MSSNSEAKVKQRGRDGLTHLCPRHVIVKFTLTCTAEACSVKQKWNSQFSVKSNNVLMNIYQSFQKRTPVRDQMREEVERVFLAGNNQDQCYTIIKEKYSKLLEDELRKRDSMAMKFRFPEKEEPIITNEESNIAPVVVKREPELERPFKKRKESLSIPVSSVEPIPRTKQFYSAPKKNIFYGNMQRVPLSENAISIRYKSNTKSSVSLPACTYMTWILRACNMNLITHSEAESLKLFAIANPDNDGFCDKMDLLISCIHDQSYGRQRWNHHL